MTLRTVLSLLVFALLATQVAAQDRSKWIDRFLASLDDYEPVQNLAGVIRIVGSDHLRPLTEELRREFQAIYPQVVIQVEAKGSATAIRALNQGNAEFGPMIREPTLAEKGAFEAKYGYKPTLLAIAIEPTPENSHARFLYLVVNQKPGTQLDPLRNEFVKFVYSRQGRECVAEAGFVPLTKRHCERQLATILNN